LAGEKNSVKKEMKAKMGTVVSNKMDKTVVVVVKTMVKHPVYKKYIKRSKRYKVHDEKNQCNIGDVIRFKETRPISKEKSWVLIDILERAK